MAGAESEGVDPGRTDARRGRGARGEIYAIVDQLAASGVAVWMISSDMEEILGMSDRVLVMHEGRISGELSRAELSEEAVMRLATGAASS